MPRQIFAADTTSHELKYYYLRLFIQVFFRKLNHKKALETLNSKKKKSISITNIEYLLRIYVTVLLILSFLNYNFIWIILFSYMKSSTWEIPLQKLFTVKNSNH